jgi:pyruvate, water dikinase
MPDWREAGGGTAGSLAEARFRHRYEGFRNLLEMNGELLDALAHLDADLRFLPAGEVAVREPLLRLIDDTLLLADTLNRLTDDAHTDLYAAHGAITRRLRELFGERSRAASGPLLVPLSQVGRSDEGLVGGKAARLGELSALLPAQVPDGFVISTEGYWLFLRQRDGWLELRDRLSDLDLATPPALLRERVREVRAHLGATPVPDEVAAAIAAGTAGWKGALPREWAVRSSAVGEDGEWTFAGQFESRLQVPVGELVPAYRDVLVSRFSERAVVYRLMAGFREADTPMAVLFLPMLAARSAGVIYTRLPHDPSPELMLVSATAGLADRLVSGRAAAETFVVRRDDPARVVDRQQTAEPGEATPDATTAGVESGVLGALGKLALRIEEHFGEPQDIEWVLDAGGALWIVQARPLRLVSAQRAREQVTSLTPLLEGGTTIVPGRAVGAVRVITSLDELAVVEPGEILVAAQGVPEIGSVLPRLAGLIVTHGNPAGHLASLLRETGVPSVFGMTEAPAVLRQGQQVGLDAIARRVYDGTPWPEVRGAAMARQSQARQRASSGPVFELVLKLNLTDPMSPNFRASRCQSLHDVVRFCHEKAVAALFDTSDRHAVGSGVRPVTLKTTIPLPFVVLDLGGSIDPARVERNTVAPEAVVSRPFQAMWRGIATPGVRWAGRTSVNLRGFASVVLSQQGGGMRALGDRNYLLVSPDYLNMNARLAYHFAMIDAWIEETAENNFVNFRFRGGGAGIERRDLRARFLTEVLLRSGFGVDRRGDLVTAWLRRYPRQRSEEALTVLGRLMGCARQLDMLLAAEGHVRRHVELFLAGDYEAFG